jgi:hypothetical protein
VVIGGRSAGPAQAVPIDRVKPLVRTLLAQELSGPRVTVR